MDQPKTCLSDFPDDLLLQILKHLPNNKLLVCESVSRSWQRCVQLLLDRVTVFGFYYPDTDRTLSCDHLQSACTWLQTDDSRVDNPNAFIVPIQRFTYSCHRFCFEAVQLKLNNLSIDKIFKLLAKCPNIKCLDLVNVTITVKRLSQLISACPNIECLTMPEVKSTKKEWLRFVNEFSKQFRQLVHLNLVFDSPWQIEPLLAACGNIKHLHLSCFQTEGYAQVAESLKKLDQVTVSLAIGYSVIDPNDEPLIAQLAERATFISIPSWKLAVVGKHRQTFDTVQRLEVYTSDWLNFTSTKRISFPSMKCLRIIGFDKRQIKLLKICQFKCLDKLFLVDNGLSDEQLSLIFKNFDKLTINYSSSK